MHRYHFRLEQPEDAISYTAEVEAERPEDARHFLVNHLTRTQYIHGFLSISGDMSTVRIWERVKSDTPYPVVYIDVQIYPPDIRTSAIDRIDGELVAHV